LRWEELFFIVTRSFELLRSKRVDIDNSRFDLGKYPATISRTGLKAIGSFYGNFLTEPSSVRWAAAAPRRAAEPGISPS